MTTPETPTWRDLIEQVVAAAPEFSKTTDLRLSSLIRPIERTAPAEATDDESQQAA